VKELLDNSFQQLGLSAREYDQILKLSRRIADLVGSSEIEGALGGGDPVSDAGPATVG
jgi:predicted ATPase with chaperone activity